MGHPICNCEDFPRCIHATNFYAETMEMIFDNSRED